MLPARIPASDIDAEGLYVGPLSLVGFISDKTVHVLADPQNMKAACGSNGGRRVGWETRESMLFGPYTLCRRCRAAIARAEGRQP